ncbi:IS66 family transposase [Nocardiopsis metallicus]|uniref:Transposase n=1 Tax=Nocardiopsis metallicus TaxID=179819 RepID=A0A840WVY5_9ACTN|nr:IS66 family transposase [Nocardiopsis metallicus]MBB5495696.1 transposase [Nocardiopsis metallicus]
MSTMPSGLETASREDLLALIGVLHEQNTALRQHLAQQTEEITRLKAENEQLRADNARLTTRVAQLERRLGRNSGNSSLPPSDLFDKPERAPAKKSARKRGRQPGAEGFGLPMVENPDQVHDHLPATCTGCHAELDPASSIGYQRRQVRDIPLVTVQVSEHRAHTCACQCGSITQAAMPQELAASPSSYGPHLRTLAVYLLVFQHIPVERTAQLINDLTGAKVSTGWVSHLLGEAHALVSDSLNLIRALLTLAHVLHADETTTRIKDQRCWLHVACNEHLTLLGLAPRSRAGANTLGVLPGFTGTLVHDSLALYSGYTCAHQLCGAHLIRELTAAEQDHPGQHWHRQIRSALATLAREAGRVRCGQAEHIPAGVLLAQGELFHHGIAVGLSCHPRAQGRKQSPARNLLERLRERAEQVLGFSDRPHLVPFTNNLAERALRPLKTQVKISGCHQSRQGAAAWLGVRSYIDSARKHGVSAFEALRRAFTGQLWMPPIPASA